MRLDTSNALNSLTQSKETGLIRDLKAKAIPI